MAPGDVQSDRTVEDEEHENRVEEEIGLDEVSGGDVFGEASAGVGAGAGEGAEGALS